jgi:hypothetical protein
LLSDPCPLCARSNAHRRRSCCGVPVSPSPRESLSGRGGSGDILLVQLSQDWYPRFLDLSNIVTIVWSHDRHRAAHLRGPGRR